MYEDDLDDEAFESKQPRRLRLIPLTMVMLSLMLLVKLNELYIGSEHLRELYTARDARANAEPAKEEKKEAEKPAEAAAAPEGEKKEAAVDAKKEEAAHGEEKKEEGGHGEAKKEEGGHGGGEAKEPEEPKTFGTGKSTIKEIEALKAKNTDAQRFTQSEIDLLENLSKRRDELDKREKEIEIKAKVLEATDKRIADKITEMKALEAQLSKVVSQYDEKQNAQIASLVKIYESMKPQQAAAIFNELDLPILLDVIDRMSERKVAPVLALMDPKKARDVTQELAAMRKAQGAAAPKKPAGK